MSSLGLKHPERPSDPINLVFIGSREQVAAAFTAAGWSEPRPATVHSGFASAWAIARNAPDVRASMSSLLLNDLPADLSWEKGFDDVSKRHHIRLWETQGTLNGERVWAGAATRDVDFAYFRSGRMMTHSVARLVDNERDKVAADLAFATCADAVDWVDRSEAPRVLTNGTGDQMETDGRVLVIHLNDCATPRKVGSLLDPDTLPEHGGAWQRIARRQIMCLRNDFIRANPYWRSFEGARMLISVLRHRQVIDPDAPTPDYRGSGFIADRLNTFISYR